MTIVDGLPVTTAARTVVVDLLLSRAEGAHIGSVIVDAEKRGVLDIDMLASRIDS